jgi:hypothetical protein
MNSALIQTPDSMTSDTLTTPCLWLLLSRGRRIRYTASHPISLRHTYFNVGPDTVVGIAIRYELDGKGIESRWGRDFQYPSRPALGPTQPPVQWVPGHSRG